MADRVVLRKRGDTHVWVADYKDPTTGKRKQNTVESWDAGWQLINDARQQHLVEQDVAQRTGVKQPPREAAGTLTLTQAFELSWERRWKGIKTSDNVLSHWKQIREYFGPNTQLDRITAIWLDQFRQDLLSRGNSNATVNRKVSVIKSMRMDAITYGRLADVPMWPKQLEEKRIEPRWLDDDEITQLRSYFKMRAARSLSLPSKEGGWAGRGPCSWTLMEDAFVVRLSHGSRCQETINLTPRDIRGRNGSMVFKETKNGRPRTVPIIGECKEILERRCKGLHIDAQIFPMHWRTYCDNFRVAVRALRLPGRVTGHITRGTMATRAITNGMPLPTVQHFCGWTDIASVNHYAHNDTQALESMHEALKGIAGNN